MGTLVETFGVDVVRQSGYRCPPGSSSCSLSVPSRVSAIEGPASGEERMGRPSRLAGICTVVNRRLLGGRAFAGGFERVGIDVEAGRGSDMLGYMV